MNQTDEIIYSIIAAEFSGETLSEEEREQLDEWLGVSGNRRIYDELAVIYTSRERVALFGQIETPENFRSILKTRKYPVRRWLKYAAVILPLAILSVYAIRWAGRRVVETDLKPGVVRAILITGQEEQVVLSDAGGLVRDGIVSDGDGEGLLRYEGDIASEAIHTIRVARGGEYQLELADGTKVWLNSETELSYPTGFKDGKDRRVRLRGEAYFEVAPDTAKVFIVELSDGSVTVLGTHFNVSDYMNDGRIVTTLLEGKVRYDNGNEERTLSPGQQCVYDKRKGRTEVTDFNLSKYALWKDGLFVFENISMEELGRQISRWYDVDVRFDEPATADIAFTGAMERYKPVSYILRMLEETNTVRSRFENGNIVFSKP